MKLLLKYLKPYRWYIALTLIIKTSATLVELFIPYIMSHILDNVVPEKDVRAIILWGACMILCALLGCIGNITANRMAARTAKHTTQNIRHDLFSKITSLSSSQVDKFTIPSLESRLTSDTYHLHHIVGMSMRMGVRAPILLIGGIFMTLWMDRALTVIMLVIAPFIALTVILISRCGIPLFKKTQGSLDAMTRIVREDSQGIRVIKALSKTDYEKRKFDKANRELVANEKKAGITMAISNPIVTFLLNLGLVSVIVAGALRVRDTATDPGTIVAFIQYFTLISTAMMALARIFVNSTKAMASAARINEVLSTEPDLRIESEEKYPPVATDSFISFKNVSFSYLGKKNNLSDISINLKRGGSLGIIGATGSGKTTLLQLLMRFYDVDGGEIRIGGRDVRTIPHEELNTMFGVVMQNDFIFLGSIADNIKFGRDISDGQMKLGAVTAQAAEYIEAYEDGYDHPLQSKGANLSGGQRQRLLIARALAGSPEILILDDASSALDYKTDARLRRAIRENFSDITTVVVAQRVSSVMNCDCIIVLDEGRIIGCGKHGELLDSCPVYKEISDSQIGGAFLD